MILWYVQFLKGEWLLFNANSAIFQLYHGENKLIKSPKQVNFQWNNNEVRFVLDQHAYSGLKVAFTLAVELFTVALSSVEIFLSFFGGKILKMHLHKTMF
jgi:hypothetical protein